MLIVLEVWLIMLHFLGVSGGPGNRRILFEFHRALFLLCLLKAQRPDRIMSTLLGKVALK